MIKPQIKEQKKQTGFKDWFIAHYASVSLVVFAIVVGAGYYFLLMPLYTKIALRGQYGMATLEAQRDQYKQQLDNINQLIARYQQVNTADIEKLKKVLPREEQIADLFVQLQAVTDAQNFKINSVSMSPLPETDGPVKQLSIRLTVTGTDYYGLKELLQRLEENLRLFDVNAIHFTPESNIYTINLLTYYIE